MNKKIYEYLDQEINEALWSDAEKLEKYVKRFLEAEKRDDRKEMAMGGEEVQFLIDKLQGKRRR